jgi:hypothetical protein
MLFDAAIDENKCASEWSGVACSQYKISALWGSKRVSMADQGAIYKPHLEREPLPLGASFCDGTGYGGAPPSGQIPTD